MYSIPYITWLQTKVPAVFETDAGILFSFICFIIPFIGKFEKYAGCPSSCIISSTTWLPSLSFILKSSIFIATLSGVISNLPPACPTDITISGLCSSIAFSIALTDFILTVGIVNFII